MFISFFNYQVIDKTKTEIHFQFKFVVGWLECLVIALLNIMSSCLVFCGNISTAAVQHSHTAGVCSPYRDSCSYLERDPASGEPHERPCRRWSFDNSTFVSTVTSEVREGEESKARCVVQVEDVVLMLYRVFI